MKVELLQKYTECEKAIKESIFNYLRHRFGIPANLLQRYRWIYQNRKTVAVTSSDHDPPVKPSPLAVGMPALKISSTPPRLTTAAALFLGPMATRHRIELETPEQLNRYLSGATFPLSIAECVNCEEAGQVIVCYHSIPIGTGKISFEGSVPLLKSEFSRT